MLEYMIIFLLIVILSTLYVIFTKRSKKQLDELSAMMEVMNNEAAATKEKHLSDMKSLEQLQVQRLIN